MHSMYAQFHLVLVIRFGHSYDLFTYIPHTKGPIWGRQDPGGPHVGPMNFAIWDDFPIASELILKHMRTASLYQTTKDTTHNETFA